MHDGGNSSELDVLIKDSWGTVSHLGKETNNINVKLKANAIITMSNVQALMKNRKAGKQSNDAHSILFNWIEFL